jgi:methyl-accepting chemotaxis protein
MLLARLRWSAFGLRGRIVGAVVVTAAISLGVAALVLLPRLENSLKNASLTTLKNELKSPETTQQLEYIARLDYGLIAAAKSQSQTSIGAEATKTAGELNKALSDIGRNLGAETVKLMGNVDSQGQGTVLPAGPGIAAELAPTDDVAFAYRTGSTWITPGVNQQVVRAAASMSQYDPDADSVLVVRKSIDEIPLAADAVRSAFAIAALVAILLTLVLAIPLAAQLVRRLQRLRQAALQLAIGGNVADFPADRARDEVGDLARSFSIMQRRLRQQEEARRAFVATASHELRTPLASLDGMLELLADDLQAEDLDLDDAAALLGRARVQSRRLGRLAADLLDLSRIDAEVRLRSEPIELSELGRAVLAEFELASTNRGVSARLEDDRQSRQRRPHSPYPARQRASRGAARQ